jgi:hypothetical protein
MLGEMPKRSAAFHPTLEPLAGPLPAELATGVGRALALHSQLDWLLGHVLYSLLEISIKQGRAVVQRPQAREYVAAIQGLFAYHKLQSSFAFDRLATAVERADAARDALVSSVYMHDSEQRKSPVYLVRGSWATGVDLDTVRRDAWPETPRLEDVLGGLLDDVRDAVARAQKLRETTDRLLRKLHTQRRTNPRLNRRK